MAAMSEIRDALHSCISLVAVNATPNAARIERSRERHSRISLTLPARAEDATRSGGYIIVE
jgi:hypothetical protein